MKHIDKARKLAVKSKGFLTKKGSLINYKEVHSFGIGVLDGLIALDPRHYQWLQKAREAHEDVDSQPHYYHKTFVTTYILKFVSIWYILIVIL